MNKTIINSIIFLATIFLYSFTANAQQSSIILDKTFKLKDSTYQIEVKKDVDRVFEVTIGNEVEEKKETFTVKPLTKTSFENGFEKQFPKIAFEGMFHADSTQDVKALKSKAGELFFDVAAANFEPDPFEPDAGKLTVRDTIFIKKMPSRYRKAKNMLTKKGKSDWIKDYLESQNNLLGGLLIMTDSNSLTWHSDSVKALKANIALANRIKDGNSKRYYKEELRKARDHFYFIDNDPSSSAAAKQMAKDKLMDAYLNLKKKRDRKEEHFSNLLSLFDEKTDEAKQELEVEKNKIRDTTLALNKSIKESGDRIANYEKARDQVHKNIITLSDQLLKDSLGRSVALERRNAERDKILELEQLLIQENTERDQLNNQIEEEIELLDVERSNLSNTSSDLENLFASIANDSSQLIRLRGDLSDEVKLRDSLSIALTDAVADSVSSLSLSSAINSSNLKIDFLVLDTATLSQKIEFERNEIAVLTNSTRASVREAQDNIEALRNERATLNEQIQRIQEQIDIADIQANRYQRDFLTKNEAVNEGRRRIRVREAEETQWIRSLSIEKDTLAKRTSRLDSVKVDQNSLEKELALAERQETTKEFIVESVQYEFHNGYIENILILGSFNLRVKDENTGKIKNKSIRLKFENEYPIGFSTKRNFKRLNQISLYADYKPIKDGQIESYRMKLGDLMSYNQVPRILTKDYSPKNGEIKVVPPQKDMVLKKEATNKLFEAHIYSDFAGINEFNPNGLIQTEISKKIPLRTRRFPFFTYRQMNIGYLTYVEPKLIFSKIDNKERYLIVDSKNEIIDNALFSQNFANTIELREYQNFSTGMDINAFLLDVPNLKSTLYLDFGFRYGRTSIQDSIQMLSGSDIITPEREPERFGVETYQLFPKFIWKISPDERYGFELSYTWNLFFMRDNRLLQVENGEEFLRGIDGENTYAFERFELGGFFKPNEAGDGKIFFRYRFHHQRKRWNTNFDQWQIGYSFFINTPKK